MADDKYTFEQARVRLEEIVTQVRKKDVSLEKSIELLEEGVRLANQCTELSDHTEWKTVAADAEAVGTEQDDDASADDTETGETPQDSDDPAGEPQDPEAIASESDEQDSDEAVEQE